MQKNRCGAFRTGRLVATSGVLDAIPQNELIRGVARHIRGDWGEVCGEDQQRNDEALKCGERLLSAYHSAAGIKFWVITEADRSATTVLLPSEY